MTSAAAPGRVPSGPTIDWTGVAPADRARLHAQAAWPLVVVGALLVVAVTFPWYAEDSYWIGAIIGLTVMVVAHTCRARAPWIPGLIIVTASVEWVIAPWAGYHVAPYFPLYAMVVPSHEYFAFAGPATFLLAAGIYAPIAAVSRRGWAPLTYQVRLSPTATFALRRACDSMVIIGVLVNNLAMPFLPLTLRYAGILVANLAFVGAFALCLMRAPGWHWRMAAVVGSQIVLASTDGVFHDLLLWTTYFVLILTYRDRLRPRTLLVLGVAATYVIATLNSIKYDYRHRLDEAGALEAEDRVSMLAKSVGTQVLQPSAVFSDENIRRDVTRLNQGWIISRLLRRVPAVEPYAHGETLVNAVMNVVVPRIARPDKFQSGGTTYFERFTGLSLRGASMNFGLAGEMYVNFGNPYGNIGVLIFGVLIGLTFVAFSRAAKRSPLWWAWAPYVMLYTAQAETGIGEVTNQVSKSILVMVVVITLVPAWRSLRAWRLPPVLERRLGVRTP